MSDLLASMKLLCIQMWPQHTDSLDDLRLEVALRMLKSPHFNARMNALKEVRQNGNLDVENYSCNDKHVPVNELCVSNCFLADQVTKLIDDTTPNKVSKTAIDYKTILQWLVENKVLSIALEGRPSMYTLPFDLVFHVYM